MVGKVWPTADAVDQKDVSVPATDEEMAAFFGKAEYFPNFKTACARINADESNLTHKPQPMFASFGAEAVCAATPYLYKRPA